MQRIRPDAIALGQEGVRRCVHHFVARGALWLGAKKVWDPPRRQRAVACEAVGDPKPPEQPVRKWSAKVDGAGSESDRNRSKVNERGDNKFPARELRANTFHVVKLSERNPIVQRHEHHDETLKGKQYADGNGMHEDRNYTALFPFLGLWALFD